MLGISDKITQTVRRHGRGNRVYTPKDFLALGGRAAVDQALSRLAQSGGLRRLGRGFYDYPRTSRILKTPPPPDPGAVAAAVARRDGVRIMPAGMAAANALRLTNAVQAKVMYVTDGPSRTLTVGGQRIRLMHAGPRVMRWADSPGAYAVQALLWLGPKLARDAKTAGTLKRTLPDAAKKDLIQNRGLLPGWTAPVIDALDASARVCGDVR